MELASLVQLERCHRRHDQVMTELLEAARRLAAGRPDDGDLDRVREAVAYFERAVARHFVDEEGSVFPRLSTRRPELAQALAELSAEHPLQIALQADVASAAHELDGEARPTAGKVLLDAATKLADAHRAHVGREDALFANAHEALTAEDDAEIVAEMETRRGRDDNGHRHRGSGGGGGGGGGGSGGGGRGGGRGGRTQTLEDEPAAKPARTAKKPAVRTAKPSSAKPAKPASKPSALMRANAKPAAKGAAARASAKPAAKASPSRAAAKARPGTSKPAPGRKSKPAALTKRPAKPSRGKR
ncbi:MAG TPA: hemerythrin domain-containing protein [Kofleriaceae bacterium]|nr:hemerythrin domain-containing protein [Kofleriaceae bacterium]